MLLSMEDRKIKNFSKNVSNFGLSHSQLVKGLVSNISKEILHLNLDKLIHIHQIRYLGFEP